jgi:hypothetical protein
MWLPWQTLGTKGLYRARRFGSLRTVIGLKAEVTASLRACVRCCRRAGYGANVCIASEDGQLTGASYKP